jgi:FkbM family methyltransferase
LNNCRISIYNNDNLIKACNGEYTTDTVFRIYHSGEYVEYYIDGELVYSGIDVNNTYYFENEGWNGICFEPIPELFEQLKFNRKCKLVQKAISDNVGFSQFFKIEGYSDMLSGLADKYPQDHIARINREIEQYNQNYDYIEVMCSTFDQEVNETNIDLLSIDTEGAELAILKTINFSKYNINIMLVEYNYYNSELLNLLYENNFEIVQQRGVDLIIKNKNYVY